MKSDIPFISYHNNPFREDVEYVNSPMMVFDYCFENKNNKIVFSDMYNNSALVISRKIYQKHYSTDSLRRLYMPYDN